VRLAAIPQDQVDPALDAAVRALQVRAFPRTADFRESRFYRHRARPGDLLVLAFEGERLAGATSLFFATARPSARPDASPLRLAGLGNICSDPDPALRGQGYAAACVRRALEEARAACAAFALLFCREALAPYYARFGFRPVENELLLVAAGAASSGSYRRDHHDLRLVAALAIRAEEAGDAQGWPEGELLLDCDTF